MIKATIVFTNDNIMVRDGVGGEFPILKSVLNNMKTRPVFETDEDETAEWDALYQARFNQQSQYK